MNTTPNFGPNFGQSQWLPLAAPDTPMVPGEGAGWAGAYRFLIRRARMIAGLTLLICLLALPFIMAVPKLYHAQTRVLASPASTLALTASLDGRQVSIDLQAELERLTSKDVTDAVIERFDLAAREEFNPALKTASQLDTMIAALRARLLGSVADPAAAGADDRAAEKVARAFRNALTVYGQNHVNVITVGFTSRDPRLAAEVPAAVVETYLAQRTARWQAEMADAAAWLDRRIAAGQSLVAETRVLLDRLNSEIGTTGGDTEDSVASRLSAVTERQTELERERFETAAARRSIDAAVADPDIPALAEPDSIDGLRTELKSEEKSLREAALVYGENHDTVSRGQERVAAIRAQIRNGLIAYGRSLDLRDAAIAVELERLAAEADAAREQISAIRTATPQVKEQTEDMRARELTLADLEYRKQLLLSQAKLAPVTLEVISPASVPLDPVGPGRKVYLLATGFGALLFSLAVAALLQLRDNGVRSHEQLTHLPHLVPVGLWSHLTTAQKRQMRRDIIARIASPSAEAVRDMLLMLESFHGGRLPQVLAVTSPRARDMAAPVADWIALEIAASGRTVHLIETAPPASPSILRLTSDKAARAVQHGGVTRKYLADVTRETAGDIAGALRRLLDEADEAEAVTIIQAPPLLDPGALRFARIGGPVLVVLRWGHTPPAVVELVAGLLAKLGTPQVFSLIVDVRPHLHRLYGFTDRLTVTPRPRLPFFRKA